LRLTRTSAAGRPFCSSSATSAGLSPGGAGGCSGSAAAGAASAWACVGGAQSGGAARWLESVPCACSWVPHGLAAAGGGEASCLGALRCCWCRSLPRQARAREQPC
jgi:hypothetical protein